MDTRGINQLTNVYLAVNQFEQTLNQISSHYDISYDQFILLKLLKSDSNLTPTTLSQMVHSTSPAISRKTKILQSKKLLKKVYGIPEDQRKVKLEITDLGNEVVEKISREFIDIKADDLIIKLSQLIEGSNESKHIGLP